MQKAAHRGHKTKLERIEARLLPEQKKRIEHAARLRGTSVSDFMVRHAEEAAIRTIAEQKFWTLHGSDQEAFIRAILSPPAPNARLKTAVKRYRQRTTA